MVIGVQLVHHIKVFHSDTNDDNAYAHTRHLHDLLFGLRHIVDAAIGQN